MLAALDAGPPARSDAPQAKALDTRAEARWVRGAEVTEMIARWRREADGG